jgi:ATP-dependent RNA helicase DeaD
MKGIYNLKELKKIEFISSSEMYFCTKRNKMKFEELELRPEIMKAIQRLAYEEATPIQAKCIPEANKGRDVVGQSLTGSGKTAAFGIPILERIERGKGIQAVILTPTRELACQVKESMDKFALYLNIKTATVYGGVGIQPQIDALKKAEVVVATPGRMLDHIGRQTINLKGVKLFVLDEADKMFEMGFIDDVKEIMRSIPKEKQMMLFSATMGGNIQGLIKAYLKDPYMVREKLHVDKSLLKQVYYNVNQKDKFSLLVHLLKSKTDGLAIIFCGTRHEVDNINKNLKKQGIKSLAVHGGLSQNMRSYAVEALKKENISVMVATDVAARGLDINNISHIFNYDSPKNSEEYTHRIGRTARAGNKGEAITLLSDRDHDNFRSVMSNRDLIIENAPLPTFERMAFERHEERRDNPRFGRGSPGNGRGGSRGFGDGRRGNSNERPSSYESTQSSHATHTSRPSNRGEGTQSSYSGRSDSGSRPQGGSHSGPRRFGSSGNRSGGGRSSGGNGGRFRR